MTRPLQAAPCRQISLAIDDDLLDLLDRFRREDPELPSRSAVARSLMWSAIDLILSKDPEVARFLTYRAGKLLTECEAISIGQPVGNA